MTNIPLYSIESVPHDLLSLDVSAKVNVLCMCIFGPAAPIDIISTFLLSYNIYIHVLRAGKLRRLCRFRFHNGCVNFKLFQNLNYFGYNFGVNIESSSVISKNRSHFRLFCLLSAIIKGNIFLSSSF